MYTLIEFGTWNGQTFVNLIGSFNNIETARNHMMNCVRNTEYANEYCVPEQNEEDEEHEGFIYDCGYKSGPITDSGNDWSFTCRDDLADGTNWRIAEHILEDICGGADDDSEGEEEGLYYLQEPTKVREWNKDFSQYILI